MTESAEKFVYRGEQADIGEAVIPPGYRTEPQAIAEIEGSKEAIDVSIDSCAVLSGCGGRHIRYIYEGSPKKVTREEILEKYMDDEYWWINGNIAGNGSPFTRGATQTETNGLLLEGTDIPSAMVFNFEEIELSDAELGLIADSYKWFIERVGDEMLSHAQRVVLSDIYDSVAEEGEQEADSFRGLKPVGTYVSSSKVITLDKKAFRPDFEAGQFQRYKYLVDQGVQIADIIITHELAHAVGDKYYDETEEFKERFGWEERRYKIGPRFRRKELHAIEGLGHDSLGAPVTDYGFANSAEDFAESTVFFRFAPELLDEHRLAWLEEFYGSEPSHQVDARVQRYPQPLYPYAEAPEELHVSLVDRQDAMLLDLFISGLIKIERERQRLDG